MGMVTLSSWALQGQGLCLEVGSLLSGFMFSCPRVSSGSAAVGPGHWLSPFSPCQLGAEVASVVPQCSALFVSLAELLLPKELQLLEMPSKRQMYSGALWGGTVQFSGFFTKFQGKSVPPGSSALAPSSHSHFWLCCGPVGV